MDLALNRKAEFQAYTEALPLRQIFFLLSGLFCVLLAVIVSAMANIAGLSDYKDKKPGQGDDSNEYYAGGNAQGGGGSGEFSVLPSECPDPHPICTGLNVMGPPGEGGGQYSGIFANAQSSYALLRLANLTRFIPTSLQRW